MTRSPKAWPEEELDIDTLARAVETEEGRRKFNENLCRAVEKSLDGTVLDFVLAVTDPAFLDAVIDSETMAEAVVTRMIRIYKSGRLRISVGEVTLSKAWCAWRAWWLEGVASADAEAVSYYRRHTETGVPLDQLLDFQLGGFNPRHRWFTFTQPPLPSPPPPLTRRRPHRPGGTVCLETHALLSEQRAELVAIAASARQTTSIVVASLIADALRPWKRTAAAKVRGRRRSRRGHRVKTHVDNGLADRLRAICKSSGRSMSGLIAEVVAYGLLCRRAKLERLAATKDSDRFKEPAA